MLNTLFYSVMTMTMLLSATGCVIIDGGAPDYNSADLARRLQPPADNDAQYIPPRGYNNGYYNDNDSQYVPPRGYRNNTNNEDYYYPLYSDY